MSALDAIRDDVAALRDTLAGINARREQIDPEITDHEQQIAALRGERVRCLHDSEQAAMAIRRLERAEALLIEHVDPEPVEADPVPPEPVRVAAEPPAPTQERARIRSELDEARRSRHEAESTDRLPAGEAPGPPPRTTNHRGISQHALADPLHVVARPAYHRQGRPGETRRTPGRIGEGGYERDLPGMLASPVWVERADLVVEMLRERNGACSGVVLRDEMACLMDCKLTTAQTTVSRCLAVLHHQGRVMDTGQKDEGSDGRVSSPIWKLKEESP